MRILGLRVFEHRDVSTYGRADTGTFSTFDNFWNFYNERNKI